MDTKPIPINRGAIQKPLMGHTKPRIMTPALKGESRGAEFAEFAEKCGYPLMPWQRFCAAFFLSLDS